jgi:predicted dehydrogenase
MIGIGVIGMGWMGIQHSRGYLQIPDRFPESGIRPRLVICADAHEARAREAQSRLGFARFTTEWREVIADSSVDVVNVATPNAQHLEIVSAALAAGKHVLCEKPVGRTPAETKAIARAARDAGVITFVGLNYRWAPMVQHAHALISAGRLGQLTHYRGRFFAGYASSPTAVLSWRFQQDHAGFGTLGDLMSHAIDMAHFIAGPIVRVVGSRATFIKQRPQPLSVGGTHFDSSAEGPLGDVTNEDYTGALVEFSNGVRGTLEACRVIQGPQCQMAFEVNGTEGSASWDFERMNELELLLPNSGGERPNYQRVLSGPEHPFHARFNPGPGIGLGYEDLKTIEAYRFLDSVAHRRQSPPGFEEIARVAEVQEAIQSSWDSGRWETVNAAAVASRS